MSYYRHLILSDPYLVSQVAHYPFDTNANDLVNNYNGTSNNINYANTGIVGNCATFNGTNSSIQIPNPVSGDFSFGTGAFSINMWIFRPSGITGGIILNKRDGSNHEYTMQLASSAVQLILPSFSSGTNRLVCVSNIIIPANVWTMITFTFAGGTNRLGLKCYIDGINRGIGSLQGTYVSMSTSTASLWLGRQGNVAASFLNGRLDQTRIWKGRELNATEITDIYNTLY